MKSSFLALALLGGALAIPIAEPQDLCGKCHDDIPDSPNIGAPFNDDDSTTTISYFPTLAASSAALAVSSALAEAATTVDASATTTTDASAASSTDASATTTTDASAASSTDAPAASKRGHMAKRYPCEPYAPGNGPTIHSPDDSVASFYADPYISSAAFSVSSPAGYSLSPGYQNLTLAVNSPTYMTFTTGGLTSYDPSVCATHCNSITGCVSFNIYFERDPSENADDTLCPNPPSLTRIKCVFFGSMITTSEALNGGQYQSQFQVVIAGSNVYNKPPTPMSGFSGPTFLNNAAINAPTADNSYMRVQTFPQTQMYDPSVCAAACNEMSAYNIRHANGATPRICRFFDAYILYKNGANGVFTCTYYTQAYDASYATNTGQYRGTDHYTVQWSYTYALI